MKKLILFLMLLPFLSYSQEWTHFSTLKNGTKQYYKKHSENVLYKKIWIKEEGANLQMINNNKTVSTYSGYNLTLYNVDCRDRKIAIIQVNHYDIDDKLLSSIEGNEYKLVYTVPGSSGDKIIEVACDN